MIVWHLMHSSEWKKKAEEFGRLAQKAPSILAKQRLLAQQQRYQAIARAREKEEQLRAPAAGMAIAAPADAAKPVPRPPRPEPSALIKASPFLTKLWDAGVLPVDELERRARNAESLRERFGASPTHAQQAAQDPDYWNKLHDSRITL